MTPDIITDGAIALDGIRDISRAGVVIARYDGPPKAEDRQVVEYAARQGARVLVVVGDSYLVADAVRAKAREVKITLAISHTPDPIEAGDRVLEHADALLACERGSTVRLMAVGPEPVPED